MVTPKRIAWLLEGEEKVITDIYQKALPDSQIDFFETPSELLAALGKGYDLFVLGLVCACDPYDLSETDEGMAVGLRAIEDIKSHPKTQNTPVLFSSTLADHREYREEIRRNGAYALTKPYILEALAPAVASIFEGNPLPTIR